MYQRKALIILEGPSPFERVAFQDNMESKGNLGVERGLPSKRNKNPISKLASKFKRCELGS